MAPALPGAYGALPDRDQADLADSSRGASHKRRRRRFLVVAGAVVLAYALIALGQAAWEWTGPGPDDDWDSELLSLSDRQDGLGLSAQLGEKAGGAVGDAGDSNLRGAALRPASSMYNGQMLPGSMSKLKPKVVAMPDQYYNVFYPPNKTKRKRPHAFWKPDKLRYEVALLMELYKASREWEQSENGKLLDAEGSLNQTYQKGITEIGEAAQRAKNFMPPVAKLFWESLGKLRKVQDDDVQQQEEADKNLEDDVRSIWEHLEEMHGTLDWDKMVQEARRLQLEKRAEMRAGLGKLELKRLDEEEEIADKQMNDLIQKLREHVAANVTKYQAMADKSAGELQDLISLEDKDREEAEQALTTMKGSVTEASGKVDTYSVGMENTATAVDGIAKGIAELQTGVGGLENSTSGLETRLAGDRGRFEQELDGPQNQLDDYRNTFSEVLRLIGQAQQGLRTENQQHAALEADEKRVMSELQKTIASLHPQMQNIMKLDQDLASMRTEVSLRLATAEKKYGDVENLQNGDMEAQSTVTRRIEDAMSKLSSLEDDTAADALTTSYDDIRSQLDPVNTEISMVEEYKTQLNTIDVQLADKATSLEKKLKAFEEVRKAWAKNVAEQHSAVDRKIAAELLSEHSDETSLLAEMAALKLKIATGATYKKQSSEIQAKLKAELADTTESLLLLDKQFSRKIEDAEERLADLDAQKNNLAVESEVSAASDALGIKVQDVMDQVKDAESQVARAHAKQHGEEAMLKALKDHLVGAQTALKEAIAKSKAHLERHPDLFERVSCTCYDGDKLEGHCTGTEGLSDASVCTPCPEGSYCLRGIEYPCRSSCPAGQELKGSCPRGSSEDATQCEPCPEGKFCADGEAKECLQTCEDGEELRGACPAGSIRDGMNCRRVAAGFWATNGVAMQCMASCSDGEVLTGSCPRGSALDQTKCEQCPSGSFCEGGEARPCKVSCPSGQYLEGTCEPGSQKDSTECIPCEEGFYCRGGLKNPCKDRCPSGQELQGSCPANSRHNTVTCQTCPAGHFCPGDGAPTMPCKSSCAPGMVLRGRCRSGSTIDTTSCEPCPEGSWCVDGVEHSCTRTCPAGQELTGHCAEGSSRDLQQCQPCPAGSYCQQGRTRVCRESCPDGQYLTGSCSGGSIRDMTSCKRCERGNFCAAGVMTECKTKCGDGLELKGSCGAGSTEDTTHCEPCEGGHYCVGHNKFECETTCSGGLLLQGFCDAGSKADTTTCIQCPPGKFCVDGKAKECVKSCRAGLLLTGECVEGSSESLTTCETCSEGSFCAGGEAREAMPCRLTCEAGFLLRGACPAGSYKDTTHCDPCPPGFFCEAGQAEGCKQTCEPGFELKGECPRGSKEDSRTCDACPEGHFCTEGLRHRCRSECPVGYFLDKTCEAGATEDTTTCTECPPGHFCNGSEPPVPCKSECPDGQTLHGECASGAYQDRRCVPCHEGFFCKGNTKTPCRLGCDDGKELEGFCPAGSEQDSTSCEPCPEGFFCADAERHQCKTTCPPGQLLQGECPAGSPEDSTECVPCPEGSYCQDGKALPCLTSCPNGHVLQGTCPQGSSFDVVSCDLCPEGSFCVDGTSQPCRSQCPDGRQLLGSCSAGSVEDQTHCSPSPAGTFSKLGVVQSCRTECEPGNELTGFCSAGSVEDTTTCEVCRAGFFCTGDGEAVPCKSKCDDGEVFAGECPAGSKTDVTTCNVCPEGFHCSNGVAVPCRSSCPSGEPVTGSCPPGSVADTTVCRPPDAPQPVFVNWWEHKTAFENCEPDDPSDSGEELRLNDHNSGFVEGSAPLPMSGAVWRLQFYIAWPKYVRRLRRGQVEGFPYEDEEKPEDISVKVTINGNVVAESTQSRLYDGKLEFVHFEFEGGTLDYRFDFSSESGNHFSHPFLSSGELAYVRDVTTDSNGAGVPTGNGYLYGPLDDAVDGRPIVINRPVNDGYSRRGFRMIDEPTVHILDGANLLANAVIRGGSYSVQGIKPGRYTCIATATGFYTVYNNECIVNEHGKTQVKMVFSPMLRPHGARAVLVWGEHPKDLDVFMLTPHEDPHDQPCEVGWASTHCKSGLVTLDHDEKRGYGPETITLADFHKGKYRMRVSEYKGNRGDNVASLLASEAQVVFYQGTESKRFQVGVDGIVKGNNWYVFTIDGATRTVRACTELTCGNDWENEKSYG